jgi:hypothetical protein
MSVSFAILAQPLAPDCIGLAVLFLVVLALLHTLNSLRPHRLTQLRRSLHELIFHRHH